MSLWFYLEGPPQEVDCFCSECGTEHKKKEAEGFFNANITHNLTPMAGEAGIYECLWRPEESNITKAAQLIEPLRNAVTMMKTDPERFKAHDSPNGWGIYDHFLPWLEKLLAACEEYPDAIPRASR